MRKKLFMFMMVTLLSFSFCTQSFAAIEIGNIDMEITNYLGGDLTVVVVDCEATGVDYFRFNIKDLDTGEYPLSDELVKYGDEDDYVRFDIAAHRLKHKHLYKIWIGAFDYNDNSKPLAQNIEYVTYGE